MTAGMHHPRILREVFHPRFFLNRQGVNIGTQHDQRAVTVAHFGHQTGRQRQIQNADLMFFQRRSQAGGGLKLLVGQLRMAMQFVTKGLQLRGQRLVLFTDIHGLS